MGNCSRINKKQVQRKVFLLTAICLVTLLGAASGCTSSLGGDSANAEGESGDPSEIYNPIILNQQPGAAWYNEGCDLSGYQPVTDLWVSAVLSMSEPQPRAPFLDPTFGTCVVRVTDRNVDLTDGDTSGGMKNEYSRVQSFNADETLLVAYATDGNWYLYDALTLQVLGQLPIYHEPRWDAEDPDLLYYSEETRLMSFHISTGKVEVVHDFSEDFPGQNLAAVWMKYEGSPSFDGRYWGLMAEDQDWMTVALLVYNLEADQVTAVREIPPSEIDSVTISPSGSYFLAYYDNYCERGQLGTDEHPCGLMVYDQDLENGRGLLRIIGHSDPAFDALGNEVLIYQDIDTDHIAMLNLASGEITPLFQIDFSRSAIGLHFSGRASLLPGWVLVSTSNGADPSATWMDDQVFAVELVENGRVVRLAHTHSVYNEHIEHDYWAEPHGSVNRDFTKIVFTSNWGRSGTDKVDMYMIRLPEDWTSLLP